jgi:hypothetical protein
LPDIFSHFHHASWESGLHLGGFVGKSDMVSLVTDMVVLNLPSGKVARTLYIPPSQFVYSVSSSSVQSDPDEAELLLTPCLPGIPNSQTIMFCVPSADFVGRAKKP